MNLDDFSARFKQTRTAGDAEAPVEAPVIAPDESYRIRAKMVGVLLCDARLHAGRTRVECASVLRTDEAQIEAWELGDQVPSLPQLELLAYYLDVPVSHFWGATTFEATRRDYTSAQTEYMALRDRLIGALLAAARDDAGLTIDDLADAVGMTPELISQYELGEVTMPMHHLTVLADAVRKNIDYFLESGSQLGQLLALREAWKHFSDLPEDLRRFAANPLNVGFLEIALALGQMPTDRLRRIGESVLSITM